MSASAPVTAAPVVTLKPRRAQPFFGGHPWVFAGAIAGTNDDISPGDAAVLRSHEGHFVAWGLFNPDSNIRLRLYSWQEDRPLDLSFWATRIDEALALRQKLFGPPAPDRGCRLVFSEADGLSGLTLDRYGEHLVLQWTSRALAEREAEFVDILQEKLQPAGIWRRTERGIGEAEGLAVVDGLIAGSDPPRPLFLEEHGVRYGVDVTTGQKTGFYFDQRDNRRASADYVSGRLLDVFCYTGGFGLTALVRGSVREVLAVDSSATALEFAHRNAELNSVAEHIAFRQGAAAEVMAELAESGERFDSVVLDPPKMARTRGGIDRALKGYSRLNRLAVSLLNPGGILVTCSCSGLVSRDEFRQVLQRVATESGRRIQILEERGQAPDHPISVQCPENAYLKCLICRVV